MTYKLNPITGKLDFYLKSHLKLSDIGTRTHAQIDTKLDGIEDGATADQTKADIDGLGLSHDSLVDVSANDHHNELHSIASHNDTSATGAQLDTLTDNSIADALHRHSELVASDGSPDPALSVDASGNVGIGTAGPAAKLHVVGTSTFEGSVGSIKFESSGAYISFSRGNANYFYNSTVNGYMLFVTNGQTPSAGTASLVLKANGNVGIAYNAGRVGIGTANPATSALLDLTSTTGALLLTRMTTTQKNAMTAVNGMLVYDSTLNKFQGYENGSWTSLI